MSWKVCNTTNGGNETTLTDLVNTAAAAPEHAYYDAKLECYCYDWCPNRAETYLGNIYGDAIQLWAGALVLFIGVLGNLVILAMFQTKDLKNMPSRTYFQALAISDTIVLLSAQLASFMSTGFDVNITNTDTACKLRIYSLYVAMSASAWLVSALSIDRFVSVIWPMKASSITYTHRVIVVAVLYAIFALLYSHFFVYFGMNTNSQSLSRCGFDWTDNYNHFFSNYFSNIELVVKFLAPLLIIVFCNVGMVISMRKSEQTEITSTKSDTQASKRLTVLFIVIGTAFVVTVAPFNIYVLTPYEPWMANWRLRSIDFLIATVLRYIAFTNHVINFFLYCFMGRKFRSALMTLLRCKRGT